MIRCSIRMEKSVSVLLLSLLCWQTLVVLNAQQSVLWYRTRILPFFCVWTLCYQLLVPSFCCCSHHFLGKWHTFLAVAGTVFGCCVFESCVDCALCVLALVLNDVLVFGQIFRTVQGRGWGLRLKEEKGVRAGTLLHEYLGEVRVPYCNGREYSFCTTAVCDVV